MTESFVTYARGVSVCLQVRQGIAGSVVDCYGLCAEVTALVVKNFLQANVATGGGFSMCPLQVDLQAW